MTEKYKIQNDDKNEPKKAINKCAKITCKKSTKNIEKRTTKKP